MDSSQATPNTFALHSSKVHNITSSSNHLRRAVNPIGLDVAVMSDSSNDLAKAELESEHAVSHFRFADLPPELRNLVYEKCLEDVKMRLPRPKSGSCRPLLLSIDLPLVLLNKTFSEEFKNLARTITADIETTVVNYDFQHVCHFLESCSTEVLQRLESGAQILTIELSLLPSPSRTNTECASKRLSNWLWFVGKSAEEGRMLDSRYVATPNAQITFRVLRTRPRDNPFSSRGLCFPFLSQRSPLSQYDAENREVWKMRRALLGDQD